MALARCNLCVQDAQGNIINGASIRVEQEAVGFPLVSVYSDRDGLVSLGNPFAAADGRNAGFHVAGGAYRITASKSGMDDIIWRYVAIGTAAEFDTEIGGPVESVNGQTGVVVLGAGDIIYNQGSTDAIDRTIQNRLQENFSLLDFGAIAGAGHGATNKTAIENAIKTGRSVFVPPGTYEYNGPITISAQDNFKFWAHPHSNTWLRLKTNTDGITFDECGRFTVSGFIWDCDTDIVTSAFSEPLIVTGTGQGIVDITDNEFRRFPGPALIVLGDTVNPMSGFRITRNYFLANASVAGGQVDLRFMNDSWFYENKIGVIDRINDVRAAVGVIYNNCRAGNYERNYHWNNVDDLSATNADYTRFIGNRFEEAEQRGVSMSNTDKFLFVGNTLHTNSQATSGSFPHAEFFNCTEGTITGNAAFTWNAILTNVAFSLDSNCDNIILSSNTISGFSVAPISYTGSGNVLVRDNLPRGTEQLTVLAQSAVAVPHTGTTSETTLATITVPANMIGLNGTVRIHVQFTHNNSANNHIGRLRFGGILFGATTQTTVTASKIATIIFNRNSASSQYGGGYGQTGGDSAITSAINTTVNQNITITGQLANSGDTITLETYLVEILRAQ